MLLLDNYDSFTWNLYHYLGDVGGAVEVHRNDALSVEHALAVGQDGIIISPGPCDPDRAGISVALVRAAADRGVPVLGVCLGHQSIFQAFGGRIERAPTLMHGKTSAITHEGRGVFTGLASPFTATRYHSLHGAPATVPDVLLVTATSEDGLIMGVQHVDLPIFGVQFHPESIETRHGHRLLRNFLDICRLPAAA